MTTFSYFGNDWTSVINRAVRGRPECKFTHCERLQLRLRDKANQLQRLDDLAGQLEDDIRDTQRAIRQNLIDALRDAAFTLGNLVVVLAAVGRLRAIISSLKRLLNRNDFTRSDLAALAAEITGLGTAVSGVQSALRALDAHNSLDRMKSKGDQLSRDARSIENEIESIVNELDRDCFSSMRNVG